MLVKKKKNNTILHFIFSWVYLENIAAVTEKILFHLYCYYCNRLRENLASESIRRMHLLSFNLWHIWIGFFLSRGTAQTWFPVNKQSHPLYPAFIIFLILMPFFFFFNPPPFYSDRVHWNCMSGKLGYISDAKETVTSGPHFLRIWVLLKPQTCCWMHSASTGCSCDVHIWIF